jgi:zinc transporter ZupT
MTLLLIVLASVSLSLLSLVGGLILVWKKLNSEKVLAYIVSFAAGTMLAVAFLDLLPEALVAGSLHICGCPVGCDIFFLSRTIFAMVPPPR